MPLLLRPATEADSTRIGWIGRDAFRDSFPRSLFPPHLAHKSETGDLGRDEAQWRAIRNMRAIRDGKPVFVVVDIAEEGSGAEALVGFAQWEPPSQSPPSSAALFATSDPIPGSFDQDKAEVLFRLIKGETKKALGPTGHSNIWSLTLIGVDPAHQGRGIGKMLLAHGLDMARKDGKDVFLVSTPAGRGLYQSVGFREVGEPFPVCGIPHYLMLWSNSDTASS